MQSVIDYINIDSNNNFQIGKSSFNLKGEVVLNEISLSNKESDTIFFLETLKLIFFLGFRFKPNNSLNMKVLTYHLILQT